MQFLRKHTSRREELSYHEQQQMRNVQSLNVVRRFLEVIWEKRRQPKDFFSLGNEQYVTSFLFCSRA